MRRIKEKCPFSLDHYTPGTSLFGIPGKAPPQWRSIVKEVDCCIHTLLTDVSHAFPLGEKLLKQFVGVLVGSSLPGAMRMSEVDIGSQSLCHFLVSGKFFPVVKSDVFARFASHDFCDNLCKRIRKFP